MNQHVGQCHTCQPSAWRHDRLNPCGLQLMLSTWIQLLLGGNDLRSHVQLIAHETIAGSWPLHLCKQHSDVPVIRGVAALQKSKQLRELERGITEEKVFDYLLSLSTVTEETA